MGRHALVVASPQHPKVAAGTAVRRPLRSPWTLPLWAFATAFAFILVMVVDPYSGAYAAEASAPRQWDRGDAQKLVVAGEYTVKVERDGYKVTQVLGKVAKIKTASFVPAAGVPDPGSAKAIGLEMVTARGWGNDQYSCLVALWNRESHWNVYAHNGSGAYGIPQALPGSKMGSAGPNWQSDAHTQIAWGLGYIAGRYGTPCGAWAHSQSAGWY